MWANDFYGEALNYLCTFSECLVQNLPVESAKPESQKASRKWQETMSKLLARCYFKQGEWQYALKKSEWTDVGENGCHPF